MHARSRTALVLILLTLTLGGIGSPADASSSMSRESIPAEEELPPGWVEVTPDKADELAGDVGAMSNRTIQSLYDWSCLNLENWGTGRRIQVYSWHGGLNQDWAVWWNSSKKAYSIRSHYSTQCIDGYAGRGAQIVQYPCDNTNEQYFIIHYNYIEDYYVIENLRYRGQCLDVRDNGRGYAVQLWDCVWNVDKPNQWWSIDDGTWGTEPGS